MMLLPVRSIGVFVCFQMETSTLCFLAIFVNWHRVHVAGGVVWINMHHATPMETSMLVIIATSELVVK